MRKIRKGLLYLREHGLLLFIEKVLMVLHIRQGDFSYMHWRKKHIVVSDAELEAQKKHTFAYRPLFSIVVPLYKTPEVYLRALVASIQDQTYDNWELCLSDGSGSNSPLEPLLAELTQSDPRIRVVSSEQNLQISDNTNAAIGIAKGEYLVFADHDDVLAETALYECALALNEDPDLDIIYSDEDKVSQNGKTYFEPHFKPDFNLAMLRSNNYICHLMVLRRTLVVELGGLRGAFDGAQDHDLILRCVEKSSRIRHIPKVLYHWRSHMASTAQNPDSKSYAFEAGARAVTEHYQRLGLPAKAVRGENPGIYRTIWQWEERPLVSVIIPNKDHEKDLETCVRSIVKKSTYPHLEFVIVENGSEKASTFACYERLKSEIPSLRTVTYDGGEFNFASICNFGAEEAAGEYLLFLNNDTEMINADAIEELLGYAMEPGAGAVGARLYYPDNTVQHAGVIIGLGGVASHAFVYRRRGESGYFSRMLCAVEYSAVTAACVMMPRNVFEEAGGFDPAFAVAYNDIDLCLRLVEKGLRIIYSPYSEWYHYESKSRGLDSTPEKKERFESESSRFMARWHRYYEEGDPYYNPNCSLRVTGGFALGE